MKQLAVAVTLIIAGIVLGRANDAPRVISIKPEFALFADCAGANTPSLSQSARDAISEDAGVAESAIRALRGRGSAGLAALLTTHAETLKLHTASNLRLFSPTNNSTWLRLRAALDSVGQQRDCYASQLYWHTDFEQAKAAARTSSKPILSLRLLGKLDEEFSCANSRFFRTTLYANQKVASYLRDHYILHWKSVRPVPKVTIDFGDGRKLEQTLTGNSIHYVLNSEGGVIDALPGLYSPNAFLQELERGARITTASDKLSSAERQLFLHEFHRTRLAALTEAFKADLQKIGHSASETAATYVTFSGPHSDAANASRRAVSKGRIEKTILPPTAPRAVAPKTAALDDATWQKIAALHADSAKLDDSSRNLIQAKSTSATEASRLAISKSFTESPVIRQIRNLERSIAEDTARNEYLFHTKIHEWLSGEIKPDQLDQLNSRVYAELFLTPDSDPWLGLLPGDSYTALENNGVVLTTRTDKAL